MKIAVLCGGPSQERGISLNSARSVLDHLGDETIDITPFYVDPHLNFYEISKAQLYSNTPSDFDFKLAENHTRLNEDEFGNRLKNFDLIFPALHGRFGEDGQLQELLEDYDLPYIGTDAEGCRKMFNKNRASFHLRKAGFHTLPSITLREGNPYNLEIIEDFFKTNALTRAIVKPSAGGSSIGVFSVSTPAEALEKLETNIFGLGIDQVGLLEPFSQGQEFTIIILQNESGEPVALVPTQISMSYDDHAIFDFRRKYLPTNMVSYFCPPNFSDDVVAEIREKAQSIFKLLGCRDFARLDGWLMPDGKIWFSDFNPISGMEQNSFLFQQAARVGLSHSDILRMAVKSACRRYNLTLPNLPQKPAASQNVRVLFGGATAERQVSLMSGTNVWLKLRKTGNYCADPYFLDTDKNIWRLPYMFCLFHTVEEIAESCRAADGIMQRLKILVAPVQTQLGIPAIDYVSPGSQSIPEFIEAAKRENAFIFLGLHGGIGEDGTLQNLFDEAGLVYNGSGAAASRLCMDKSKTGETIMSAAIPHVITAPKTACVIPDDFVSTDYDAYWQKLCADLKTTSFIIKPRNDGCSAGVIHLRSASDIETYVHLISEASPFIPPQTFAGQKDIVELSRLGDGHYLIEAFIETDTITIDRTDLHHVKKSGWIELTIGVLAKGGQYHALNPSITVAEGAMLSLEEKFQGGTGINITPPPETILSKSQCENLKSALEKVAAALGIDNYARIDLFYNRTSNDIIIIEANSLPGLTPSTVLYHQALAERPKAFFPPEFLSMLISMKLSGRQNQLTDFMKAA